MNRIAVATVVGSDDPPVVAEAELPTEPPFAGEAVRWQPLDTDSEDLAPLLRLHVLAALRRTSG